jgi:biotin operon repressor
MITKHDVLAVLQRHQGHLNGVTAEQLALQLGIEKRQMRHLVTELRLEGIAVCGHPKTGYFIAATHEEMEETCKFLRSRAMHSLTLEARLRKLTLPDLLGQMRLKT